MVTADQQGEKNPRIFVVTRGGVHTGIDASMSSVKQLPWVHKVVDPLPKFDPAKGKHMYQES